MAKLLAKSVAIFVFSFINTSVAQDQILRDLQTKARTQLNNANYREAYNSYEKLLAIDANKCSFNYEMGVCVFLGSADKTKAQPYFEKAQET